MAKNGTVRNSYADEKKRMRRLVSEVVQLLLVRYVKFLKAPTEGGRAFHLQHPRQEKDFSNSIWTGIKQSPKGG